MRWFIASWTHWLMRGAARQVDGSRFGTQQVTLGQAGDGGQRCVTADASVGCARRQTYTETATGRVAQGQLSVCVRVCVR
eukprot:3273566-Rhodomonas_salina.1